MAVVGYPNLENINRFQDTKKYIFTLLMNHSKLQTFYSFTSLRYGILNSSKYTISLSDRAIFYILYLLTVTLSIKNIHGQSMDQEISRDYNFPVLPSFSARVRRRRLEAGLVIGITIFGGINYLLYTRARKPCLKHPALSLFAFKTRGPGPFTLSELITRESDPIGMNSSPSAFTLPYEASL